MGYERITDAGLKLTIQRMAILEYLEGTDEHPSAEMVYNNICKKFPTITLSTVYNTLETFVKHNIINKVSTTDGKARYDGRIDKHFHFFDKRTGRIVDIEDAELQKIIENYFSKKNYPHLQIEDFQINLSGEIKEN